MAKKATPAVARELYRSLYRATNAVDKDAISRVNMIRSESVRLHGGISYFISDSPGTRVLRQKFDRKASRGDTSETDMKRAFGMIRELQKARTVSIVDLDADQMSERVKSYEANQKIFTKTSTDFGDEDEVEDRPLRINPNADNDDSSSAGGGGGGGGTHVVLVPFFPAAPRPGGRFRGAGSSMYNLAQLAQQQSQQRQQQVDPEATATAAEESEETAAGTDADAVPVEGEGTAADAAKAKDGEVEGKVGAEEQGKPTTTPDSAEESDSKLSSAIALSLGSHPPPPPAPKLSLGAAPPTASPTTAALSASQSANADPKASETSSTEQADTSQASTTAAGESPEKPSGGSGTSSSLGADKAKIRRRKLKRNRPRGYRIDMSSLAEAMFAPPGTSPLDDSQSSGGSGGVLLPMPQWAKLSPRPTSVKRSKEYTKKEDVRYAELIAKRDTDEFIAKRDAHFDSYGDLAELSSVDEGPAGRVAKQQKFYKEHNELVVDYLNSGFGDLALLAAEFLASVGQLKLKDAKQFDDIILLAKREAERSGTDNPSESILTADSLIALYEAKHLANFEVTAHDVADLVEFYTAGVDANGNSSSSSHYLSDMIYALRHTSWAKIASMSPAEVAALAGTTGSSKSKSSVALFSDAEFERYVLNAALFAAAEENETSTALRLLTLFQHAKPFGVRPTYESFSFVVRALAHSRKESDRKRIFPVLSGLMAQYDVKPDIALYNSIMSELCSGCVSLQQPRQLLDQMLRDQVKPDRNTMAALVWAAQFVGTTSDVKYLLTKIPEASEDFEKLLLNQLRHLQLSPSFLFGSRDSD